MIANINNIEQVYNELPDRFVFNNTTYDGYKMCEDLHFEHGWRDVVIPTITSTQKLSQVYTLDLENNIVTKEVIEMSEEEIEELLTIKKETLLKKLQFYSSDLRVRAKAVAIGKKGDRDYIFAQVEMYELKYKIALDLIVGEYFTNLLTNEAIEFGASIGVVLDLETFKELIINRYETAEAQYRQFLFMIERCRTFIQTLIETNQFERVDDAFALIDTLTDASQAITLMANILNL